MAKNQSSRLIPGWLAIVFAVLVILLGVVTAIAASMSAEIFLEVAPLATTQDLSWDVKLGDTMTVEPTTMDFKKLEVEVTGKQDFSPQEGEEQEAYARGEVILVNNSGNDQTLVATTRLLSKAGVLFRIEKRVTVPAGGELKTIAKADQKGATGNIEPTDFIIPGLSAALQEKIYARSEAPISGGTVKTGVIGQNDLDNAAQELQKTLTAQAETKAREVAAKDEYSGYELAPKMFFTKVENQSTSGEVGKKTDSFTSEMKLKYTALLPKTENVLSATGQSADAVPTANSAWELKVNGEKAEANLSWTGIPQGVDTPTIDKRQLTFKTKGQIEEYLATQKLEVRGMEINFTPAWLKLTPITAKNINLEVK